MSSVLRMTPRNTIETRGQRATAALEGASADVVAVYEHWLWMMAKNPRRCALGPDRRKAIGKALKLYDAETLMLAVEGCASSPFHMGDNDRGQAYNDITLIVRDEAHIERFAELGERLRADMAERERAAQRRQQEAAEQPAADPAQAAAAREALRKLAQQVAASGRGGRRA